MATRSLGTLTLDLVAKIGGFERGMDQAARKSERTAAQIARDQKKRAQEMEQAWANAGTAIGVGLTAATAALAVWIKGSVDAIDQFNDLKDITGSSIENISALDAIARQTGGTFDQVSATLTKFNGILKDADPTKGPGAVLKALNLDIEELKRLDPAEALRQTAVALQGYADDGAKARAVQELFGKSVKDVAPFLKDLAEAGELQAKVSTKQAEEIDRFNKEMAKAKASADDLARALSIDLVTSINDVSDAFIKGRASGKGFFEIASDRYWKNIKDFYRDIGLLEKEAPKFQATIGVDDQSSAEMARLLRQSALPSLTVPPDPTKPKKNTDAERAAKEAQTYLENLQKQLQATENLSVAETVLADIRSGRLKLAGGVTEAELVGVAKQIDAARALTKTMEEQKKAMEAIDQMQAAMDSQALAEVETLIQGNQALRDEIELLGLEGSERAKVEQARLAATIALKEEELQMAKTNGASATQISALEREIRLLQQRGKLLEQKGARLDQIKAIEDMLKRQEQAYKNIQDALGQGLYDVATGNFDNIGKAFTNMLTRMAAEAVAADLMNSLFGTADAKGQRSDGVLSDLFKGFMGFFTGSPARANGGGVMSGGLYEINENGPEVLAMGGRQYLMMGNQGGTVMPNRGGSGGTTVINMSVQGPVDRRTEAQVAQAATRGVQRAQRWM